MRAQRRITFHEAIGNCLQAALAHTSFRQSYKVAQWCESLLALMPATARRWVIVPVVGPLAPPARMHGKSGTFWQACREGWLLIAYSFVKIQMKDPTGGSQDFLLLLHVSASRMGQSPACNSPNESRRIANFNGLCVLKRCALELCLLIQHSSARLRPWLWTCTSKGL